MKTFEDQVRAVVEIAENPFYDKVQALDLYVQKMVMDQLVTEDTARFLAALEKIGEFDEIEPVQRFHEVFQKPLNATHAAASVGLVTVVFFDKISKSPALQNLLGSLVIENGTVKRDAWTSNFDEVISILNTPDSFHHLLWSVHPVLLSIFPIQTFGLLLKQNSEKQRVIELRWRIWRL